MMNAFDQIISSAGHSRTGHPKTTPLTAWSNHSSLTSAMPFPELKIRSTKSSPLNALPSQWENVRSVWNPAWPSASRARGASCRVRKTSPRRRAARALAVGA
jgi:hypothetical protein